MVTTPTKVNNSFSWGTTSTNLMKYIETTPGQLSVILGANLIAIVMLAFIAWWTLTSVYDAVKTMGKDTVPSIIAAEAMRAKLADANANAVNVLLPKDKPGDFEKIYRQKLDEVQTDLVAAAENITYGEAERKPILEIMKHLGTYQQLVGRATVKVSEQQAINDYIQANKLMREQILVAGQDLDKANSHQLDLAYEAYGYVSAWFLVLVAIAIVGLTLGGGQWLLFQKTKRMVNPGFAVASLVITLFVIYWVLLLQRSQAHLTEAKESAFTSIYALWQAKAIAYDANADESLYLLYRNSPEQQKAAEADFKKKVDLLAVVGGNDFMVYVETHSQEFDPKSSSKPNLRINGFLGDELANITFEGEEAAAVKTLQTWITYRKLDGKIRELARNNQYNEAIALNVGTKQGESNWAFGEFDKALDAVIKINKDQFDFNIDKNLSRLDWFPYVLGLSVIVASGACIAGMRPRLDEYRF